MLAAARQSISLEQGEYKLLGSRGERLAAYQINLPIKGSDLQIRNFVAEVLNEVPVAALEDVSFQRQAIGESGCGSESAADALSEDELMAFSQQQRRIVLAVALILTLAAAVWVGEG